MAKEKLLNQIPKEGKCNAPIVAPDAVVTEGCGNENRIDQLDLNASGKQWSKVGEDCIISVSDTFEHLEPGYYSLGFNPQIGMYFRKEKVNLDKLYRMPNHATDVILEDLGKFWTLRENYKKYHQVFRRNYLLYSAPGTGKTSLINIMCQDLINEYHGIVFNLTCPSDIENFPDAVRRVRNIDGNIKIIAVIEDIDTFIGDEHSKTQLDTCLLNILDGNYKMSDLVIIATTNYIERVQARYKNRPSRFNRVIEFPLPDEASRKLYIENTVFPEDLEKINIDEWVKKTEGFTIDHIKELTQQFFIFGNSEEEAFEAVSNMVNNNNRLRNSSSVKSTNIGF